MYGFNDLKLRKIENYTADGRKPLVDLWENYFRLTEFGWECEEIAIQKEKTSDGSEILLPIFSFKTPLITQKGKGTFWILGGVHGEEPSGPNAFAEEVKTIIDLGQKGISVVFLPLLNPSGYHRDWRYEDEIRDFKKGHSVTDSENYLLSESLDKPRMDHPASDTASNILKWVVEIINNYPPRLVIDHHEDRVPEKFPENDPRNIKSCYVYATGKNLSTKITAKKIIEILRNSNMPIEESGKTRFGEEIIEGVVKNSSDGSIDEFLAADKYYDPRTKEIRNKYSAETVLTVETTIPFDNSISLKERVVAHKNIIRSYFELWKMLEI